MRRFLRRVALGCCLLLLSGCARIYEGSYISVTDREEAKLSSVSDEGYYEVHTYSGIRTALLELISAGAEEGVIRTRDYAGSVADDVSRVCLDITRDSAIGAYAVEYITHSVSRILSYYEVKLHIAYRVDQSELAGVQNVISQTDMYRLIDEALCSQRDRLTVQVATLSVTERSILSYADNFYYQNPDKLSARPNVAVTCYPSEEHVSKVIELDFSYVNLPEEEQRRQAETDAAAAELIGEWGDKAAAEYGLLCCEALSGWARFTNSGSTAYDALVLRHANSEGFAMAYALLCDRLGVSFQVVEGKKDGMAHFWNILKLGQSCYHVDVSACGVNGLEAAFLLTDDELIGEYWWDVDRYPRCHGSLTEQQVYESCYGPTIEEDASSTENADPSAETE